MDPSTDPLQDPLQEASTDYFQEASTDPLRRSKRSEVVHIHCTYMKLVFDINFHLHPTAKRPQDVLLFNDLYEVQTLKRRRKCQKC